MGSSRKAKARHKSVHTKVQIGLRSAKKKYPQPVVLPGTDEATPWSGETTLRRNYRALGLASDANAGFGRVNPVVRPPEEVEGEAAAATSLAAAAVSDAEALRVCTGQPLAKGQRAPKQLTARQLRVMGALVEAHGDDVVAMCRDMKRNAMQHTAGTLRVLLDAFHAQHTTTQRFRAPIKGL